MPSRHACSQVAADWLWKHAPSGPYAARVAAAVSGCTFNEQLTKRAQGPVSTAASAEPESVPPDPAAASGAPPLEPPLLQAARSRVAPTQAAKRMAHSVERRREAS
jgi:hypothetical protein